jgi:hypothetical protein
LCISKRAFSPASESLPGEHSGDSLARAQCHTEEKRFQSMGRVCFSLAEQEQGDKAKNHALLFHISGLGFVCDLPQATGVRSEGSARSK